MGTLYYEGSPAFHPLSLAVFFRGTNVTGCLPSAQVLVANMITIVAYVDEVHDTHCNEPYVKHPGTCQQESMCVEM
jgi:hypothetical protein